MQLQSISSWLSKNCDEDSRMREISYSKSPPTCAHARIFVAIWTTNWKSTVAGQSASLALSMEKPNTETEEVMSPPGNEVDTCIATASSINAETPPAKKKTHKKKKKRKEKGELQS